MEAAHQRVRNELCFRRFLLVTVSTSLHSSGFESISGSVHPPVVSSRGVQLSHQRGFQTGPVCNYASMRLSHRVIQPESLLTTF